MDSGNCHGSSSPCAMRRSRSTAGASILLALFFILFCGVVAVVVLRFAAVNGERTAEHAREENTYYAVTSAEGLVEDTFSSSITGGSAPFVLQSADGAVWTDPGISADSTVLSDQIKAWMYQQACIVHENAGGSETQDLTLNISGKDLGGTAYPADGVSVDVILSMSSTNYDISISAAVHRESDADRRDYYAYTLTRTVKALDDRSGDPETLSWSIQGANE